jgi:hypothetical protein
VTPFPEELPGLLDCAGHCRDIADRLHAQFEQDFRNGPVYHRAVVVYHNRTEGTLGYEEGFWHMVTREDKLQGGKRFFEHKRAAKLAWAKPLLESAAHERIRIWDYDTGNRRKGIRTFLWLEDWDYVVILKRIGRPFMLVTAYDVDDEKTRRYFERLYANRV